mmetsp:Transcript_19288/g.16123  ORF Transcript_19288/g.16123 Transcript_19288/m.16123 type:complete len:86 (-) Transcript_19288:160-417(-)
MRLAEVAQKAGEVKEAAANAGEVMQDDKAKTAVDAIGGEGSAEKVTEAAAKAGEVAGKVQEAASGTTPEKSQQQEKEEEAKPAEQ